MKVLEEKQTTIIRDLFIFKNRDSDIIIRINKNSMHIAHLASTIVKIL